jgi:serine/threonine protein kinase
MSALGRYRAIKQLAAGGMGEVFLAEDSTPPQGAPSIVAIKRVAAAVASDPERLGLFRHEAHLLTNLAHRHIVRVYEVGEDDHGCFVTMELVEGPSLRHLLDRLAERGRRLPPAVALEIAAQVGDALAYAYYSRGPDGAPLRIIHRDVSPRNILVSRAGEAKLIDFGIAQSLRQPPGPGPGVIGKVGYRSPEQLAGEPLNARSDLFSLGIVVCEMLSGRHPFERGSAEELAQSIRCGAPLLPSASAPELAICDPVLLRMLAKRPSDRFIDGLEAAKELGNLRAQVPKSAERLGDLVRDLFDVQLRTEVESLGDGQGAAPPGVPGIPASDDSAAPLEAPVPASRHRTLRLFPLERHSLPETGADPQFSSAAPDVYSRGRSSAAAPEAAVHIFVPGQADRGPGFLLGARPTRPLAVGAANAASEAAEPATAPSARMVPVQFFRPGSKPPPEPPSSTRTQPPAESGPSATASNPSTGPAGKTPPAVIWRFPAPAPDPKVQPKAPGAAASPPTVESLALAAQQAQDFGHLVPKGAATAAEPAPGAKAEPPARLGAERADPSKAQDAEFPQVTGSAATGPALASHAPAAAPSAQSADPHDLFHPAFSSASKPIEPSAAPDAKAREEAAVEKAPELATGPWASPAAAPSAQSAAPRDLFGPASSSASKPIEPSAAPDAIAREEAAVEKAPELATGPWASPAAAPAESAQPGASAALAPTSPDGHPETPSALSARLLLEARRPRASPADAEEPAERAAPLAAAELLAARGRAHQAEAPEPESKADFAAAAPAPRGAPPEAWPVPSELDAEAASAQGRAAASPRPRRRRGALSAALALAAIAGAAVVFNPALRRQVSRLRQIPAAAESSARAPEQSPAEPFDLPTPALGAVQGAALSPAAAAPEPAPPSAPSIPQLRPPASKAAAPELFRRALTRAKPADAHSPPAHRPAGSREERSDPLRPQIQAPAAEERRPEAHRPAFRLSVLGLGASVRRTLSGSAQLQIWEAEGVAVSLSYRVEDSALRTTLTSEPWTIVAVDGLSVGKTPVPLPDLLRRPVRLELRRPGAAPISLELYARPEP